MIQVQFNWIIPILIEFNYSNEIELFKFNSINLFHFIYIQLNDSNSVELFQWNETIGMIFNLIDIIRFNYIILMNCNYEMIPIEFNE